MKRQAASIVSATMNLLLRATDRDGDDRDGGGSVAVSWKLCFCQHGLPTAKAMSINLRMQALRKDAFRSWKLQDCKIHLYGKWTKNADELVLLIRFDQGTMFQTYLGGNCLCLAP